MIFVVEAVYSLEDLPARYPIAPESKELGQEVRFLLLGRKNRAHKIYFEIRYETPVSGTVRVFHIQHWARETVSSYERQTMMDESGGEPGEDSGA